LAPGEIFQPYAGVKPAVAPPVGTQAPMQIHAYPQVAATAPPAAMATGPGRESLATCTVFALDLGSEPNMDGLRAGWANLRGNHGGGAGESAPPGQRTRRGTGRAAWTYD
jgi:hypothetical protein